jgi:hypothetical protein
LVLGLDGGLLHVEILPHQLPIESAAFTPCSCPCI